MPGPFAPVVHCAVDCHLARAKEDGRVLSASERVRARRALVNARFAIILGIWLCVVYAESGDMTVGIPITHAVQTAR